MKQACLPIIFLATVGLSACSYVSKDAPSPASPGPVSNSTATPIVFTPTWTKGEVTLRQPQSNETVSSPFLIAGVAPGTWFFEGQILAEIQNKQGETLATLPLQAVGEWLIDGPVEFSGTATFPESEAGEVIMLIVKNDNPSGLAENDRSVSFPLQIGQKQ